MTHGPLSQSWRKGRAQERSWWSWMKTRMSEQLMEGAAASLGVCSWGEAQEREGLGHPLTRQAQGSEQEQVS